MRSTLEELRAEDLTDQPDARVEEDFAELQRAAELLEVERLRRLAELDRRGTYARDGHLSAVAWLVAAFGVAWGRAREQVQVARALEDMPQTRRALSAGDITTDAVRVLVAARETDHEAFTRSERELVEAARVHRVRDLQRVTGYWRQAVEQEQRVQDEDVLANRRRLHATPTIFGMVRVDGDLDPETGETLLTALQAIMDADTRRGGSGDDRTPAQRRADALGEICRQWLDSGDRPTVAGERPHVTVTVNVDALRSANPEPREKKLAPEGKSDSADATGDRTEGGAWPVVTELDHAGPVSSDVARRLACDASVMRVVMAGRSEPLDVGRRTPVVSPAMRRAVMVRDRHCRFPGCDRPHTWCDAHHVVHWADGGPTALANLLLLCRRHHRLVHRRGGVGLNLEDGSPVFRRPDGSVLEDRAPP